MTSRPGLLNSDIVVYCLGSDPSIHAAYPQAGPMRALINCCGLLRDSEILHSAMRERDAGNCEDQNSIFYCRSHIQDVYIDIRIQFHM